MWTSLTLNGGDLRRRWWETLGGILRIVVAPVQTPANELEGKKIKQNACYTMFPRCAAAQFPGSVDMMWLAGPRRLLWGTAPSEAQCKGSISGRCYTCSRGVGDCGSAEIESLLLLFFMLVVSVNNSTWLTSNVSHQKHDSRDVQVSML